MDVDKSSHYLYIKHRIGNRSEAPDDENANHLLISGQTDKTWRLCQLMVPLAILNSFTNRKYNTCRKKYYYVSLYNNESSLSMCSQYPVRGFSPCPVYLYSCYILCRPKNVGYSKYLTDISMKVWHYLCETYHMIWIFPLKSSLMMSTVF